MSATPLQAILSGETVQQIIRATPEVAAQLAGFGLFRLEDVRDVTGLVPAPGIGWTWAQGRTPEFRPPAPDWDWVWNEEEERWDAPPPPPDPAPTDPEPTDPEPTEPTEPTDPEPDPEQPASAEEAPAAAETPAQG